MSIDNTSSVMITKKTTLRALHPSSCDRPSPGLGSCNKSPRVLRRRISYLDITAGCESQGRPTPIPPLPSPIPSHRTYPTACWCCSHISSAFTRRPDGCVWRVSSWPEMWSLSTYNLATSSSSRSPCVHEQVTHAKNYGFSLQNIHTSNHFGNMLSSKAPVPIEWIKNIAFVFSTSIFLCFTFIQKKKKKLWILRSTFWSK